MNINKDTAAYQMSHFLNTGKSQSFDLDYKDVALLRTIADFMDSGDEEVCFATQEKLALFSRVPRSTIIERIKKYVQLKILKVIRKRYSNHYYLGGMIKQDVQQPDISSPVVRHLKSSSRTLYNNKYNNKYNNAKSYPQLKYWTKKDLFPTAHKGSSLYEEKLCQKENNQKKIE